MRTKIVATIGPASSTDIIFRRFVLPAWISRGLIFHGEGQKRFDVVRGDVDVADVRLGRRAGVAGGDEDVLDPRRLRALPGERMFAAAAADESAPS